MESIGCIVMETVRLHTTESISRRIKYPRDKNGCDAVITVSRREMRRLQIFKAALQCNKELQKLCLQT